MPELPAPTEQTSKENPMALDPSFKMVVLAGGVGGSKLLVGLQRLLPAEQLTVIVNTGDNIELFGLYIAPDIDIVTYTLAGVVRTEMGWGIEGDTFACLERLVAYHGEERWFNLGDRDLATHLYRTQLMREGVPLHEVTERVRRHFGLGMTILPMSDQHTPTTVLTTEGPLHFQEYLIRRRTEPKITGLRFEGIESARPAPGVLDAIAAASGGRIALKVAFRDHDVRLIDAFLTNGGRSIPKVIALGVDGSVEGVWGPRPTVATELVRALKSNPETAPHYGEHLHKWYAADKTLSTQREATEALIKVQG